jgi:hypothetical protein
MNWYEFWRLHFDAVARRMPSRHTSVSGAIVLGSTWPVWPAPICSTFDITLQERNPWGPNSPSSPQDIRNWIHEWLLLLRCGVHILHRNFNFVFPVLDKVLQHKKVGRGLDQMTWSPTSPFPCPRVFLSPFQSCNKTNWEFIIKLKHLLVTATVFAVEHSLFRVDRCSLRQHRFNLSWVLPLPVTHSICRQIPIRVS